MKIEMDFYNKSLSSPTSAYSATNRYVDKKEINRIWMIYFFYNLFGSRNKITEIMYCKLYLLLRRESLNEDKS